MDFTSRKIPVFVFPTTLNFYLSSRPTHKQLLTLYNPYDFPVRFKVLCTAPNKYTVIDPDGSIGPQACVDIVIRHTIPIIANCNVNDKFRITMQDHSTKKVLGKRDIEAKLHASEPDNNSTDGENFQSGPFAEKGFGDKAGSQYQYSTRGGQRPPTNTANFIALMAGVFSIVALLMPTKQEQQEQTSIPPYLHLSVNLKLVFAYVLGLVSYLLFRT